MTRIYMDHAATTPLDERVLAEMLPWLVGRHGNASSLHREGREAREGVERARDEIAALLGAHPEEVCFTSGGTESDNAAVFGVARAREAVGRRVVTSRIEHHAVLHPAEELEKNGWTVARLAVDAAGRVDPAELAALLDEPTALVSVMAANNEVGTLQPIEALGRIARERGAPFHTDAVQAAGKLPLDLGRLPVDLASVSGHKLHGPKGIGVLYVRRGTPFRPLLLGGSQELGRRAGTENVAAIVGLAAALRLACAGMAEESARVAGLRERLRESIRARIGGVRFNTPPPEQGILPGILNASFDAVEGEAMVLSLSARGVAVTTGSACTSESLEPSHVLEAMGVPGRAAQGSLRFSLGRGTTEAEVDLAVTALAETVARLRELSPLYEAKALEAGRP